MDKCAWFFVYIRACVDAMARISEVSTTSAFMLPLSLHKNLKFFLKENSLNHNLTYSITIEKQQIGFNLINLL
jgi:hypothetical protein